MKKVTVCEKVSEIFSKYWNKSDFMWICVTEPESEEKVLEALKKEGGRKANIKKRSKKSLDFFERLSCFS